MPVALSVDCLATQGDHRPMWVTSNTVVGGDSGVIRERDSDESLSYGVETLSNYVARLSFDIIMEEFAGTYICVSGISGQFAEIYITTGKSLNKHHGDGVNNTDSCLKILNFSLSKTKYSVTFSAYVTCALLSTENPYVARISPAVVSALEYDPTRLEFRIAIQSNGNSWDTEDIIFLFTSSGSRTADRNAQVFFTVANDEFPQNYVYSIEEVDRSQDGLYTAQASCACTHVWCM